MRILITGGAGFIGSRTAVQLTERGDSVTLLDNFSEQIHGTDIESSPTYQMGAKVAEVIKGDVRDKALMFDLVPQFDAVIHLAAETGTGQSMYDVIRYNDVNVIGTANLLEALVNDPGKVRRMVIASSRSVYGEGSYACAEHGIVYPGERDVPALEAGRFEPRCPVCQEAVEVVATSENAAVAPASVYAVTKLAQEHLMLAMGHARNVPTVALRYQNVYGPGQSLNNPYTGILSIFSREMLAGRPVEIFEDGLESRDFVHVEDVARANVAAVHADLTGVHMANIGTGKATSVIELANALAQNYGYTGDIRISGRFRAGDIRHNFADIATAEQVLGWTPEIGFDDGLAGFCEWVRATLTESGGSSAYHASLKELEARGLIGGG
jgi:dTDP-L-rhamnose 4-epimerase